MKHVSESADVFMFNKWPCLYKPDSPSLLKVVQFCVVIAPLV